MSLEPNLQSVADLQMFYHIGSWNNATGWMDYGSFTFSPEYSSVVKPENAPWRAKLQLIKQMEEQKKTTETIVVDEKFPYVPLIPHPSADTANKNWVDASWSFYCSWADQGCYSSTSIY